jgi:hypothetical protein
LARPKLNIDPKQVENLAQIGCKDTEIAAFLDCSPDTITRRFAYELHKGRETMKLSLKRMMFQAANSGNVVMMIWLSKNLLGYSDKTDITTNGEPIGEVRWSFADRRNGHSKAEPASVN